MSQQDYDKFILQLQYRRFNPVRSLSCYRILKQNFSDILWNSKFIFSLDIRPDELEMLQK